MNNSKSAAYYFARRRLRERRYPPWKTGVAVRVGDHRRNANKVYVANTAGTTGAAPPTHLSGVVTDGTVLWAYVGKSRTWE